MIALHSCCRSVGCISTMQISCSTASRKCFTEWISGGCRGNMRAVNSLWCLKITFGYATTSLNSGWSHALVSVMPKPYQQNKTNGGSLVQETFSILLLSIFGEPVQTLVCFLFLADRRRTWHGLLPLPVYTEMLFCIPLLFELLLPSYHLKLWRWLCGKIPINQQFVRYSD